MPGTTLTVRLNSTLHQIVTEKVGANGSYENVSEYIRDLIRRDQEQCEKVSFERLKAELSMAFSTPESSFVSLTASEVIQRNQDKLKK